jgi:Flp pilus assembly pilin Flp
MANSCFLPKWQSHCPITVSRSSRASRERATTSHKQISEEKRSMTTLVARFVHEDSGQDLIEYGLLIGIITTGVVLTVGQIGTRVKKFYDDLYTAIK